MGNLSNGHLSSIISFWVCVCPVSNKGMSTIFCRRRRSFHAFIGVLASKDVQGRLSLVRAMLFVSSARRTSPISPLTHSQSHITGALFTEVLQFRHICRWVCPGIVPVTTLNSQIATRWSCSDGPIDTGTSYCRRTGVHDPQDSSNLIVVGGSYG